MPSLIFVVLQVLEIPYLQMECSYFHFNRCVHKCKIQYREIYACMNDIDSNTYHMNI